MRIKHLTLPAVLLSMTACGGSTNSDGASGGSGGAINGGGAGGAESITACPEPGTCTLFATNCCGGYCDTNVALSAFLAVNEAKLEEHEAQSCRGDIACPGCVSVRDPDHLALCRSGHCVAADLRKDPLSACQTDSDCRVRWGSNCCEDCAGGNPVAYNKNASLEAEVCSPNSGDCAPCAPPPYPPTVLPYCGADGHCAWALVGP